MSLPPSWSCSEKWDVHLNEQIINKEWKNHCKILFISLRCLCFEPGLILPSLSAGPSGTIEAMKMPRSSLPVLSSPTITKPEIKQWGKTREKLQQTHFTNSLTLSTSINSPNPSFGSFFKITQTISLSGGILVGVSTAKGFWLDGKFVTGNLFLCFLVGHTPGKVTFVDDFEFSNQIIYMFWIVD